MQLVPLDFSASAAADGILSERGTSLAEDDNSWKNNEVLTRPDAARRRKAHFLRFASNNRSIHRLHVRQSNEWTEDRGIFVLIIVLYKLQKSII
jgi:hypothetical protein